MIDPKELRIGNYVNNTQFGHHVKKTVYAKVLGYVPAWGIYVGFNDPFVGVWTQTHMDNHLEPIPLTQEVLEKCGFRYGEITPCQSSKTLDALVKFSFWIEPRDNDFIYHWIGGNITITTLHQLQNLYFAITGDELNIKL